MHDEPIDRDGQPPGAAPLRAARDTALRMKATRVAATGVALFAVAVAAAHALRPDLDATAAPLSFYLAGAGGAVLQAGYLALAIALVAFAVAARAGVRPPVRSAAPLLLFTVAAAALAVTALVPGDLPGRPAGLDGVIHNVAASAAFLCATSGMLLHGAHVRSLPAGRVLWRLAWLAFAGLWVHALWRTGARGLSQRAVVVLIVAWLWLALRALRRTRR